MKLVWIIGVFSLIMQGCFAPPVTKKSDEEKADHENDVDNDIETEVGF